MRIYLTANRLRGCATGALFFASFGAIWLLLALEAADKMTVGTVLLVALGLLVLYWMTVRLFQRARSFPRVAEDPALSCTFNRINALQWIVIVAAAVGLGSFHEQIYIPSAVASIVGLHLFPLARLFRYPVHYITAIATVFWAGICLFAFPIEHLQTATALGTGLILWGSAAVGLGIGLAAGRKQTSGRRGSQDAVIAS